MYKHMFMFDWAVEEDKERTQEKVEIIRTALESQTESIPGVLSVDRIGLNSILWFDTKDAFVEMTFADFPSLLMYHQSEAHYAVRGIVDPLITNFVSVDFPVED